MSCPRYSCDKPEWGVCLNGTCICNPGRTGFAEAAETGNCRQATFAFLMIWLIVLGSCCVVGLFTVGKMLRGFHAAEGPIDWEKLFRNTNFRLLLTTVSSAFFFGIYTAVRLGFNIMAFNDYLGTLLYFIPVSLVFVHTFFMGDLLGQLLEALVKSVGVTFEQENTRWLSRVILAAISTLWVPILATPALPSTDRMIMVRYWLVTLMILSLLLGAKFILLCVKAITLLRAALSETTKVPIRRIRWLMGNVSFAVLTAVVLSSTAVFDRYLSTGFPYVLALLTLVMVWLEFTSIACLGFDPSKFTKGAKSSINDAPATVIRMDTSKSESAKNEATSKSSSENPKNEAIPLT